MKTKHIFWGVFLISLGILILLRNYMDISLEWGDIWKVWPLVFVMIGVNLLLKNDLAKGILSGVTALIMAFALYASVVGLFGLVKDDVDIRINSDGDYEVSNYSSPYEANIKDAALHFEAGAGTFTLNDTTSQLFDAVVEGRKNKYSLTSRTDDSSADLLFKMRSARFFPGSSKNRAEIKLHPGPVWDLNFDIGAAAVDFDLSPFNVSKVDIEMGAASLRLRLGSISKESVVNIKAGASSIEIDVPQDAGCEITAEVSLSSRNFAGFNKIRDNIFRTDNFDKASKKIYIELHSGISSIDVNRYSW